MHQSVDLAQVPDVDSFFQRVLADGSDVDVFDRRVGEFLWLVQSSQAVKPIIRNLGDANVRLAWIGEGVRGEGRPGEHAKQRSLAYLRQADNSGFHGQLSAVSCQLAARQEDLKHYRINDARVRAN